MLEAEVDSRFKVSELAAAIVAAPLERVGNHRLLRDEARDGVGQLDLAPCARRHRSQMMEDARRQHVAAHDRQRRRRRPRFGFLDSTQDRRDTSFCRTRFDDAPASDVLGWHRHHADDRAALPLRDLGHLLHHRDPGVDQVIGQEHRERLVANDRRRAQDGMAEPQRLRLSDVDAIYARRRGSLHLLQQLGFVAQRKLGLELVRLVEMILDRALVAAGDEDHVGDACRRRFLDRVLYERLVDHREHFLRACLGRRQEARAESGHGKYRLRYFAYRHRPSTS
jgi:hypothetical protein